MERLEKLSFCDAHDRVESAEWPCLLCALDDGTGTLARLAFVRYLRWQGAFVEDDGSVDSLGERSD